MPRQETFAPPSGGVGPLGRGCRGAAAPGTIAVVLRSVDPGHPAVLAFLVRLRARWLESLSPEARASLVAMTQSRMERVFAEWVSATADLN